MLRQLVVFCVLMLATPALADPPRVVTDIAPVHSLAAMVMEGVGEPALIVRSGASPHSYALRPSEAAALASAEVVFWVGEALTPWLRRSLGSLAPRARVVTLLEVPGTVVYPVREMAVFGADDGDHGDEHDHGEHQEAAGQEQEHEHAQEDEHGHEHAHGGVDPHAWLDPENGKRWLDAMAETLAEEDPGNAARYRDNAARGKAEIDAATARIAARLAPFHDVGFVVFHDAWQYFDRRFGLHAVGAIRVGDASSPGPARLAALRAALAERQVACVFAEPQFNPGLIEAITGGRSVRVGLLDPLGADLVPGPGLYVKLLEDIGAAMADCLGAAR